MSFSLFWLVLLVLIIILFKKTGETQRQFTQKIEQLEQLIQQFRIRLHSLEKELRQETGEQAVTEEAVPEEATPVHEPAAEPIVVPELGVETESVSPSIAPSSFPSQQVEESIQIDLPPEEAADARGNAAEVPLTSRLFDKWASVKGNIDWEQFTGTKLFAWLGGLALFIGAGFFVKYSIDRNLIPPIVRLVIGAIAGIGLIIASFRFQRGRYDIMRHTLGAGGIGVLYTVVFAATLYYHYVPEPAGFFCLMVISAAAFVLAIHHQGIAISVLGAVGAYFTPIMVNTGSGNLAALFVYLAIVNIGLYQVIVRLRSPLLLLIATSGTLVPLAGGSLFGSPAPATGITAEVWIANMVLFSAFFVRIGVKPADSRPLLWSGITLYAAVLAVALIMTLGLSGCAPMFLLTAAVAGAVGMSLNKEGWSRLVIPYAACTFVAAVLWTWSRFTPDSDPRYFLLFLLYGVAGGLGPILLIKKYGMARSFLNWFKIFPVAIVGLSLVVLLKNPQISFWFWPMIICLQVVGMIVSLLFRAVAQVGLLTLVLIVSGLAWIDRATAEVIGIGFYGLLLAAGIILCATIFLAIRRMPAWIESLRLSDQDAGQPLPALTEWMAAAPVMGAFVLLAAAFMTQRPLNPHPGMATLVCFLILALTLCQRLSFQPIGMVALLSSAIAQASWMANAHNTTALHFSAFAWAGALFLCALAVPFAVYPSHAKWKKVWMAWAIFEVFQALFIIRGADHLWAREYSGWLPMILATLKLPAVAILIRQLRGKAERNALLAFHGGVLLFYVSAVPIMLLDQGWIGLTLVLESSALLWLNRRIEHPGLRWTAVVLAPAGLFLLLTYLPRMKDSDSLMILNAAVMATAAAAASLFYAVRLSSFPRRILGKIDLPVYFLWLAVGTAFYLVNLMVTDIFAGSLTASDLVPNLYFRGDLLRSISRGLLWAGFGAVLWRVGNLPSKMRFAGMAVLCLGAGWLILFPIAHPRTIAAMRPLINLGLLAYLPLMAIVFYLFLKEPWEDTPRSIKNLLLALFLIAGLMCMKIEKSTFLQPGLPFSIISSHTLSMAVGSAAGWILYGLGMLIWPKRLDRPFRLAGLILILLGLIRAVVLPFRFTSDFGALTPLLNSPTLLYAGCLGLLVFLIRYRRNDENWPVQKIPPRPFWVILFMLTAFSTMNIEIASAFGLKGRPFSLMTQGSLSHQLGYSLGWLLFSIGMLIAGIRWRVVRIRWAALILLVLTTLKIFFKDLWTLGQLYRVASFIGLAAVLILVSFLYQRYLSDRRENG